MEAALIAALVSALGLVVTLSVARAQLSAGEKQLEAEVLAAQQKLRAEAEGLRQNVLRDVLAKRMAAYAALWKVIITYERNWPLQQKPIDAGWAQSFLRDLNEVNADHGVFFSQSVGSLPRAKRRVAALCDTIAKVGGREEYCPRSIRSSSRSGGGSGW